MSEPPWREFEKLAQKILKELSNNAQVIHNDKIFGHVSRKERQIDVSIRANLNGDKILTIVQAKNWNHPADIQTVDSFASVIRDVQATKGILICKSGFTKDAKRYARNLGIKLLNLHDAETRDWNLDIKIPIIWKEYGITVEVHTPVDVPDDRQLPLFDNIPRYSSDNGKNYLDILSTFKRFWNEKRLRVSFNEKITIPIRQKFSMLTLQNNKEDWIEVQNPSISYWLYLKKTLLGYFQPSECRGVIDFHQDDAFILSNLPPIDEIPKKPEEDWQEILDVNKIPINIKGSVVSVQAIVNIESFSKSRSFMDNKEI